MTTDLGIGIMKRGGSEGENKSCVSGVNPLKEKTRDTKKIVAYALIKYLPKVGSKHLYPFLSLEYPRKMHFVVYRESVFEHVATQCIKQHMQIFMKKRKEKKQKNKNQNQIKTKKQRKI